MRELGSLKLRAKNKSKKTIDLLHLICHDRKYNIDTIINTTLETCHKPFQEKIYIYILHTMALPFK
jgi:hypothetical protein